MCGTLYGHAPQRSPGIIRKSRVSYPGPGFLSSATWPSLPKKHYNGLINQSINQPEIIHIHIWLEKFSRKLVSSLFKLGHCDLYLRFYLTVFVTHTVLPKHTLFKVLYRIYSIYSSIRLIRPPIININHNFRNNSFDHHCCV